MRGSNEWSQGGQQANNAGNAGYNGGMPQQGGYGSMPSNGGNPSGGYNINRANRTPDINNRSGMNNQSGMGGQAEVLNQGMYTDPYRNSMPTEGQVRQPRVVRQQNEYNRQGNVGNGMVGGNVGMGNSQSDNTSILNEEERQNLYNRMNDPSDTGNQNGSMNGNQPIRNPYMTPPTGYNGDIIGQNPMVDEYGRPIGDMRLQQGNGSNDGNGNNGNGNKEPEKKKSIAPFIFLSIFGTLLVCILVLWGMWKADLVRFGKEKPGDVQIENEYTPGNEPTTEGSNTTEGTTEAVVEDRTTEATTEAITTTEAISSNGGNEGNAVTPNSKVMGTDTCGYIEYPETYAVVQGNDPSATEYYQAYDPSTVDLTGADEDYTRQNGNIITLANLKETDLDAYANELENRLNEMGTVSRETVSIEGESGGGYKFTLSLNDSNKVAEFWCFKYRDMETVHCFTIECTGDNTSLLNYSSTYSY